MRRRLEKQESVYVAGADTIIGTAILRGLKQEGFVNLVGGRKNEPNLADAGQVDGFFDRTAPEYVFVAAGKSGGILANQKYPGELIVDNLLTACHIIDSSYRHKVKKLLYLASSCSYPRDCPQPMAVRSLLTGPLEHTSEAYAVAKIAGIKLCQAYRQQYGANFISAIPADVFGPGEDFDTEDSHVVAALMRKMHEAKLLGVQSVEIWGTGTPKRDFIFAGDTADACILLMRQYDDLEPVNIGSGAGVSVGELARLIKEVVGYSGELRFNTSKPDGAPMKVLDSSVLTNLGWQPTTSLRTALSATYRWFLKQQGAEKYSQGEHISSQD